MKCKIIQDLLPLYCDKLTSAESNAEIESHLQNCAECTGIYETMQAEMDTVPTDKNIEPLKKVKRHYRLRMTTLILLLILLLIVVVMIARDKLAFNPRLCYMDEVTYSHAPGTQSQAYFYQNADGVEQLVILADGDSIVMDAEANQVLCNGAVLCDADGVPVPAGGMVKPYGYFQLSFHVETWSGWFSAERQLYYDTSYGFSDAEAESTP